ncbi:regulating synaptic membrane exocytosis protein 1 isoform X2 [Nasonia vitripennis]|uniref:Regulating synaptic membrane exocytosis protein 2 n=1 Tax=Nasonia vitripennis TaxID=7425 RepID=A0A7M7QDR7_NASVI|nr:regulating synaptic membrane exocytosis protein 1 isoform X2 [Nasonia vitripennis]
MLPNSVMSFVKKMVTTQPDASSSAAATDDGCQTFSKFKQITDFMTVTSTAAKLTPAKVTTVEIIQPKESTPVIEPPKVKTEQEKALSRAAGCRVCIKSIKPEEVSRTCHECQRKVCEDCASYTADTDDPMWRCSVCRRKLAARDTPTIGNESTEGSLEVPMPEGLVRRHSDARLGPQSGIISVGAVGSGLAPPRSPDLGRRHSDVSPASLKDLEKVAGERRSEDWEWRSKSRSGSPERHQDQQPRERDRDRGGGGSDRQRGSSPQRSGKMTDQDNNGGAVDMDDEELPRHRSSRRKSRVTRQHSYDDEIKSAAIAASLSSGVSGGHGEGPPGLGLPGQLSRRKSAYDVYSAGGAGGLSAIVAPQHRASISSQGRREPDAETQPAPTSRRPSFRANKPVMPYEMSAGAPGTADDEKMINLDAAPKPEVDQGILMPDEELRTRRRGSQLPNIEAIRAQLATAAAASSAPAPGRAGPVARVNVDERELARQGSLADGEGIKIVIHDVDCDMLPRAKKKVILRKDIVIEKGHKVRSFGMRVVGGKIGSDNRLYAVVVWTVSGGPADKAGLQRGDKVLEWGGVSLIDRTFEEVAHIIDRSSDVAELVIEHATDISGDHLDEPGGMVSAPEKVPGNLGLSQLESDTNKAPSSPTRRKLPKTPEQLAKERQVTGRVQIQVWYEADRKELVVSVLAADDLCTREDTGYGSAPEAFAKLDLVSPSGDATSLKTDVAEPTHNPIWNATLNFTGVAGEQLIDRMIEVTLWDYCPDRDSQFLGGCSIDLTSAFEADRAVWYRLEDPRGLRSGRSPHCSPRGSLSIELAQRLLRRTDLRERSYSDDTQSDSGSPEPYFLHPDHAWLSNSRRGSSQSEQLEVEPYELSKDYSRSLPGSRRSSFQSQTGGTDSKRGSMGEADVSMVHYNRERRRSSFARPMRDQEEILETLRVLKAQSGGQKGELSRTMSLTGEKRRPNRRGERRESSVLEMKRRNYDRNSESDEEEKWSQSIKAENGVDLQLGPGQVVPKGNVSMGQNGKVQLAIFLSKGNLEVEVISAKDICPAEAEEPDTYIKTYLRAEERWLHKRKTRVVRHSRNPQFRQTLKYPSCDALGRNLLVMLWEKKQGFESNQGLGGAEIELDALSLTRLTIGWYHLFPIHTLGTQNADSP